MEQLFDKDSFTDEITNASEAQAAYSYFTHNLSNFRSQLSSEGRSYSDYEKEVRQCWENLLKSSQRVGFMNGHLERMAKKYNIGINKKKQTSEVGK
jgi:hypothetical protein